MIPSARQKGLHAAELDGELVIYDEEWQRAHCLNRTAELVWRHCDGQRTAADLATVLHQELGSPADENLVWLALDSLEKQHLLDGPVIRPAAVANASRRELLKRLGATAAAAVLVPAITSMIAPSALAQSAQCGAGTGYVKGNCGPGGIGCCSKIVDNVAYCFDAPSSECCGPGGGWSANHQCGPD